MARKKLGDDVSEVAAAENLEPDEQIRISDVRTIKRGRGPVPAATTADDEDDSDVEIFEVDPEDDLFPAGTLGNLLNRSDEDRLQDAQCDVLVVRKPDSAGEKFLKPCVSRMSEPPIRNIALTQAQSDIEEMVRTYYGGGHYYLQIKIGNQMQTGWSCDLADPPEAIQKARAEQLAAANPPIPNPAQLTAANPFDQFFEAMQKQHQLKEMLFGEEQRRMQAEIERLRAENERREPAAQSDLQMLLNVMKDTKDPTIVEFAKDYLSPENREPQFGIWDFAMYLFDNKDQVAGLASMLLGGMMPPATPQPAGTSIEGLLRQQPPAGSLPAEPDGPPPAPPVRSAFQRRKVERAETDSNEVTIDNDIDSTAAGMEAPKRGESENAGD